MDQLNQPNTARLLKFMIGLQIVTLGAIAYLLLARPTSEVLYRAEKARYEQAVAAYEKQMQEYRVITEKYKSQLEAWKNPPAYKGIPRPLVVPQEGKPNQAPTPTSVTPPAGQAVRQP